MNNKFVAMIAVVLLAGPMAANAVPITTSAGTFELSVIEDNFSDISGILTSQVWWGNDALATEFAMSAQALGLSALNSSAFRENMGPVFAYCDNACVFRISSFPIEGYGYSFDRSTPDFQALTAIASTGRSSGAMQRNQPSIRGCSSSMITSSYSRMMLPLLSFSTL